MVTQFEMWLDKVNEKRKEYWENEFNYKPYTPLTVKKGQKYMKVIDEGSVWAFVSMWEGVLKGTLVCKGDLLKSKEIGEDDEIPSLVFNYRFL